MTDIREHLLEGNLPFPGTKLFEKYPKKEKDIKRFFKAVWFNYLNDNATNSLKWYEELGMKLYNDLVRRLSHNGWVISNSLTGRNWADVELCTTKLLEFVTKEELEEIKARYKYSKYLLDFSESTKSVSVRQNGKVKKTGLLREGFMKSGNTCFGFDVCMAEKYQEAVASNLVKSMKKIREIHKDMETSLSSYDEVSERLLEHHMENPLEVYTTGDSYIDSRGRAISSCLNKVFNPISNKDSRSLLIITY